MHPSGNQKWKSKGATYIGTVGRIRENKFRAQTCADKFTASAFRESEGACLVEFLKRGTTVHSERYVQILKKLKQPILTFRPNVDEPSGHPA